MRYAQVTETACLPIPFTHSFATLASLPSTCRYIPTRPISPKLRLRCAALPTPIPIPFIPSLVIPTSLFSTLLCRTRRLRPETQKEASQPVRRPLAPQSYFYLGTPQVARAPKLPGRAHLPNSHLFHSALTRLDRTHKQHHCPPTLFPADPDRSSSCASALRPIWRILGVHQAGIR